MPIKIKEEFKDAIVGYNNSGKPLGQRNDLHLLYGMSKRNRDLLKYFDGFPSERDLIEYANEYAISNQPKRKITLPNKEIKPGVITQSTSDAGKGITKEK